MASKILIADDSLTIQKVIKITLANESYELLECTSDTNLISLTEHNQPDLVLLDFNLSDNKTGYDLVKELKAAGAKKVIILYGTFDTVEENLLEFSGANGHIVKPFEGAKFISLCRNTLDDIQVESEDSNDNFPEVIEESEEDQWVVNQPELKDFDESPEEAQEQEVEVADDSAANLPPVIDSIDKEDDIVFPPIIKDQSGSEEQLPDSGDLEYPDADTIRADIEIAAPKSKLIPATELVEVENEDSGLREIELDDTLGTKTDEEIKEIEALIEDETSEDDLWVVDEDDNSELNAEHVKEINDSFEQNSEPEISAEKIEEYLEPIIEKIVAKRVEEILQKVAWEVIPDLAENLIKKELAEITKGLKE